MTDEEIQTPPAEPLEDYAGMSPAHVREQARILTKASMASPVRQMRYHLNLVARAYEAAADRLEQEDSEEVAIEFAGALMPGMLVVTDMGSFPLERILQRGATWSLHMKIPADQDGWDVAGRFNNGKLDLYMELPAGQASPVVVIR